MFGIHWHRYPAMWADAGTLNHRLYGRGLIQEKRCATCGKVTRAIRFASY